MDDATTLVRSAEYCLEDAIGFPAGKLQVLAGAVSKFLILKNQSWKLLLVMMAFNPAKDWLESQVYRAQYRLQSAYRKKGDTTSLTSSSEDVDIYTLLDPKRFRTLRSFAREPHECRAFDATMDRDLAYYGQVNPVQMLMEPLHSFLEIFQSVVGLWYGGRLVLDGSMGAGDLVTFIDMSAELSREVEELRPSQLKARENFRHWG